MNLSVGNIPFPFMLLPGYSQNICKYAKQPLQANSLQWLSVTRFHALISFLRADYSIIVATRPEPTVRPPSRFVGYKILLLLGVFQAPFYLYYSKYALLFEVLKFFRTIVEPRMYKLMFIHPLVNLAEKYLMLVPCSQILLIFVYTPPSFQ